MEDDLEVEVSSEGRLEGEQILAQGPTVSYGGPGFMERHPREETEVPFYSLLASKVDLELSPPTLEGNLLDLDRMYRELRRKWDISALDIEYGHRW